MNCPKCGKPTEATAPFCGFCGTNLNEVRLKNHAIANTSSENHKNPGTTIKKMWVVSVLAIIAIIITHVIAMAYIKSEAERISEERKDHNRTESGTYAPCDIEDCNECSNYERAKKSYNQQGALQWRTTITYCTLIAFGGAIVYGIGTIAEKQGKD
ncbi:MAG: hypothetical protein IKA50_06760 [Clostridia bacterium]|nr:hypothetical protein [Clostridia bacterium]